MYFLFESRSRNHRCSRETFRRLLNSSSSSIKTFWINWFIVFASIELINYQNAINIVVARWIFSIDFDNFEIETKRFWNEIKICCIKKSWINEFYCVVEIEFDEFDELDCESILCFVFIFKSLKNKIIYILYSIIFQIILFIVNSFNIFSWKKLIVEHFFFSYRERIKLYDRYCLNQICSIFWSRIFSYFRASFL